MNTGMNGYAIITRQYPATMTSVNEYLSCTQHPSWKAKRDDMEALLSHLAALHTDAEYSAGMRAANDLKRSEQ